MIEKVIHYCWFGGNPLTEDAKKCIASWEKYCPDYEIKEWNEKNFDVNVCAYTKEAYSREKWAFVSDYARVWILFNYGGLYFDTDVELINPIDDIVERGPFMGFENSIDLSSKSITSGGINLGLGIGSDKNNPIYKHILDYYNKQHFIDANGDNDITTIVDRVSKIMDDYPKMRYENIAVVIEGIFVYKNDFFCPINYQTGVLTITDNTRSIHHYTASWQSEDEKRSAYIFTKMKRLFGPTVGKFLGYILTLPLRTKMYGLKKALKP